MTKIRKLLTTGAVAGLLGIGALAATTTAADARTVCNRYGDCWREYGGRYDYPATLGVRFYSDSWRDRWRNRDRYDRYRWREHREGRGYWRNGIWITF